MAPPLALTFLASADRIEGLPETPAEVTVIGRSNVGKSSLINALANRNGLARTSKTPGRTQLLNVFGLPEGETFVDCPGYGYAATSKQTRFGWQAMIERYLLQREQLVMILVLIDGEVGPTKLDLQLLEWLRAESLPHSIVATKIDKVKSNARPKRKKALAEACLLEVGDICWTSTSKNLGIDALRDLIRIWLAD